MLLCVSGLNVQWYESRVSVGDIKLNTKNMNRETLSSPVAILRRRWAKAYKKFQRAKAKRMAKRRAARNAELRAVEVSIQLTSYANLLASNVNM